MAHVRRTRKGAAPVTEFDTVMAKIGKDFGPDVLTLSNEIGQPYRISSGIFIFDLATLGGIPHNRISHVIGERSAGKSTAADKCIAGAQQMFPDMKAVKVDIEGTHDPVWSAKLGVNPDTLYVMQPETGESAIDATDALVRTKEVSIVVVDSIAALVPMKEIDASAVDQMVGEQARMVGRMIRKVTAGLIAERHRGHYVTVLLVNQFRSKVGSMIWGDPRSIPGGKALEFAATVQWVMKNKETMGKDDFDVDVVTENEHSFVLQKNKMNGGMRSGEFRLCRITDHELGLNEGDIDDAETMLGYAKKFGAYTGAGSSWTLDFWEDQHTYRGVKDAVTALYKDRDLYWRLRNFLIHEHASHLGMPQDFLDRFKVTT